MEEDIERRRAPPPIKFLNAAWTTPTTSRSVDFDTEVRVARFAASDYPRLVERIRMRKPDG